MDMRIIIIILDCIIIFFLLVALYYNWKTRAALKDLNDFLVQLHKKERGK